MVKELIAKKCQPCGKGVSPLSVGESKAYLTQVPGWSLSGDAKSIWRELAMKDFSAALRLINSLHRVKVAQLGPFFH